MWYFIEKNYVYSKFYSENKQRYFNVDVSNEI